MRIRTIKPEFFTHESLFDLEKETGLPIRIAFAGIWCACDRSGRFKWEPRRLGVSILPYDGVDFSRVLDALSTRGFIVKYRVGDAWFGVIPSWSKHQFVNPREQVSNIPDISDGEVVDASSTRGSRVDHASRKEGKGREGKDIAPVVAIDEKQEREQNLEFNALCQFEGIPLNEIGGRGGKVGTALKVIRLSSPTVTVEEIFRRGKNYKTHFPDISPTCTGLANHWGKCHEARKPAGYQEVRTG